MGPSRNTGAVIDDLLEAKYGQLRVTNFRGTESWEAPYFVRFTSRNSARFSPWRSD